MINDFNKVWESEYIKARVDRVTEQVERGNYEIAIDHLTMIHDKAKAAITAIRNEQNPKR